jgi:hypothetical protein
LADREKALTEILEERKLLHNDPRALSAVIRKEPLSWEEAFRIDGSKCLYNAMKLNERLDRLSWKENITTTGNFVWQEKDAKVIWEPSRNGRWEVATIFDKEEDSNNISKKGEQFYPNNIKYVIGVDPVDHNTTEDGRRSNGAAVVLRKYSAVDESGPYNYAFVCKYKYRPDSVQIFYEDMIKMAFYYGCNVLMENQKIGMMHYFNDRGYGNFLMWLPDRQQPGIAASPKTHQYIAELTESYINDYCDKVYFKDLVQEWLEFEIHNTTKFDLAMAAGYALIADQVKMKKRDLNDIKEVKHFFKKHKVPK